jgi:hypothetical protein
MGTELGATDENALQIIMQEIKNTLGENQYHSVSSANCNVNQNNDNNTSHKR